MSKVPDCYIADTTLPIGFGCFRHINRWVFLDGLRPSCSAKSCSGGSVITARSALSKPVDVAEIDVVLNHTAAHTNVDVLAEMNLECGDEGYAIYMFASDFDRFCCSDAASLIPREFREHNAGSEGKDNSW